MITCLGKSCSFGFLGMSIVKVYHFVCVCVCASFTFSFEGAMWGLIVLVPDHCLSFYFASPKPLL